MNIELTEQEADKLATLLNIALKSHGLAVIDDVQLFVGKLRNAVNVPEAPIKEETNELKQ